MVARTGPAAVDLAQRNQSVVAQPSATRDLNALDLIGNPVVEFLDLFATHRLPHNAMPQPGIGRIRSESSRLPLLENIKGPDAARELLEASLVAVVSFLIADQLAVGINRRARGQQGDGLQVEVGGRLWGAAGQSRWRWQRRPSTRRPGDSGRRAGERPESCWRGNAPGRPARASFAAAPGPWGRAESKS